MLLSGWNTHYGSSRQSEGLYDKEAQNETLFKKNSLLPYKSLPVLRPAFPKSHLGLSSLSPCTFTHGPFLSHKCSTCPCPKSRHICLPTSKSQGFISLFHLFQESRPKSPLFPTLPIDLHSPALCYKQTNPFGEIVSLLYTKKSTSLLGQNLQPTQAGGRESGILSHKDASALWGRNVTSLLPSWPLLAVSILSNLEQAGLEPVPNVKRLAFNILFPVLSSKAELGSKNGDALVFPGKIR